MNLSNVYALYSEPIQPYINFDSYSDYATIGTISSGDGKVYFSCNGPTKAYSFSVGNTCYMFFDSWSAYTCYFYPGTGSYAYTITRTNTVQLYEGTYYYNSVPLFSSSYPDYVAYNSYTSYEEGINALNYYMQYGHDEGYQISKSPYTIQNGWLTVIDLGSNGASYDINLSTQFNVNSGLISQNWSETSQTYWFSDSLPSVGSSYENTGTLIQWDRGNPRNIFGQTKYGINELIGVSTGRYLYILNPFYRSIADSEHPTIVNYPMTINGLLDGQQAYIYEVTASATVTGVVNAISTTTVDGVTTFTNWGTASGGAISVDLTNSFVNTDNDTTTIQTQGGGNANETAQTINSYLQQIQNVLDSFVEQVLGLLSAPISHIQQLINAGSNFMHTLVELFEWLPEPIVSTMLSALVVMVVIGIIKMLL